MRFVHTADWQIGKTFGFADEAAEVLRDERVDAIARVGRVARHEGATVVLVAGDVYDVEVPTERTLRQPLERMRAFADLEWHLIPGNHDPHTLQGPWERLRRLGGADGLPDNVHLHLTAEPVELSGGAAWLLPAPLTRRHAGGDPTAAMDPAATPDGALRIGLAHGSITSFGSDPTTTHNLIAADRATRAGLAYLALGDWHGAQAINDRCWYSGTPETDGFDTGGNGGGEALVVDIAGPGAIPVVSRHRVGRFQWDRLDVGIHGSAEITALETRLRGLSSDLSTVLIWLTVHGTIDLAERQVFESRIRNGVGSALRVLRLDDGGLLPRPTPADLEAIDHAGFVRVAADKLAERAGDEAAPDREIAAAALQRLYLLNMRLSTGAGR